MFFVDEIKVENIVRTLITKASDTHSTHHSWVKKTFEKRECVIYTPTGKENKRCGCGLLLHEHKYIDIKKKSKGPWTASKNTELFPTDAYGTLEFQGGPHIIRAQFIRLAYDTSVDLILRLLTKEWELELPKLLISVHGGKTAFDMPMKLKKTLRRGFLKASQTTGAWIFTSGVNAGTMKHVGDALVQERKLQLRNRVISIGFVPWGSINNREKMIGHEVTVQYHSSLSSKSRTSFNCHHSYFVLVDNGTVGKYGHEMILRKKLEKHISQQRIFSHKQPLRQSMTTISFLSTRYLPQLGDHEVPVVCVVIEGGLHTIHSVLDYVSDNPPMPVVVSDGSGRAADLLAFAHRHLRENGTLAPVLQAEFLVMIRRVFDLTKKDGEELMQELIQCVRKKELITVFRLDDEPAHDLDQSILTALLKGSRLSSPEQLLLSLAWNRVDVARSEIFSEGQEWSNEVLEHAMMDALIYDRVDFVKLLLENGVNMSQFLTIPRLEELYNLKVGFPEILRHLARGKKEIPMTRRNLTSDNSPYTLIEIGVVIEKLMGGAFRSLYCHRPFRVLYNQIMMKFQSQELNEDTTQARYRGAFKHPFNELLVWSVLVNRQSMALFMWQQGEEAMGKALVACRLYKSLAEEVSGDYFEGDLHEHLRENARTFENFAVEFLGFCYREDETLALQLLTTELQNWSRHTCLSLAVLAESRAFLAQNCCQMLLAELWMGALRVRTYTNLKVILAVLCPLFILKLDFKSEAELQRQPQTEARYIENLHEIYYRQTASTCTDNQSEDTIYTMPCTFQMSVASKMANGKGLGHAEPSTYASDLPRRHDINSLKLSRKIYEFYAAPVTKFWGYTLAYVVFLMCFTFVVLTKIDVEPSLVEYYIIIYMITSGLEIIRELTTSEPKTIRHSFAVWTQKKWNPCDCVLIIFFFFGLYLRLHPSVIRFGRVVYALSIMYWYIRILDFFSVNKYLGPFVTMIGKMVVTMLYFCVLLVVFLVAFGVGRESLLRPDSAPSWKLAFEVFFLPLWMVFGEVFANELYAPCGDDVGIECPTARWIPPAAMSVYLLIANILLVNLLIAVFNHIFEEVNAMSQQIWKFKRYYVVMEYEHKPLFPPPFIVISHIYFLLRECYLRVQGRKSTYDNGLKLFLYGDSLQRVKDFEEECVESYCIERESIKINSEDLQQSIYERLEMLSKKIDSVYAREKSNTTGRSLDSRVMRLMDSIDLTISDLTICNRDQHQLTSSRVRSLNSVLSPNPTNLCRFAAEQSGYTTRSIFTNSGENRPATSAAPESSLYPAEPTDRMKAVEILRTQLQLLSESLDCYIPPSISPPTNKVFLCDGDHGSRDKDSQQMEARPGDEQFE